MFSIPQKVANIFQAEYNGLVELVDLLKEEQICILQRKTEELMPVLFRIEEKLLQIKQYQTEHEKIFQELIPADSEPVHSGLVGHAELLPDSVREQTLPLAQKIDVQSLLVREFTWQNHVLLSHALNFLEQVLAPWLTSRSENVDVYGQDGFIQKSLKRQAIVQVTA